MRFMALIADCGSCPNPPEGASALVFPNGSGKPESHANILNRGFWPLQVTAGVTRPRKVKDAAGKTVEIADPKYSLHALRHAAAALFIQQGFTAKKVQTIMGHASIQMTYDVYGYLLDRAEDDGEAMAQMQARLLG
jgi:integrase